jgi:flagellar hook-length control protein FliK
MAAPLEALGATARSLTGPPDAGPPDGPGFQGALEDSMARTATAEGQHEKQSVSKAVGGREAATDPEALASAAQPGAAADLTTSRSEATTSSSGRASQASGTDLGRGAGHSHSADAKASSKGSTDLVSQVGTSAADAATAGESQAQSGATALATEHAGPGAVNLDTTAGASNSTAQAAPVQAAAGAGPDSQRDALPTTASSKATATSAPADAATGIAQADGSQQQGQEPAPVEPAASRPGPTDAPPATGTTAGASVLAQDDSEAVTPSGQPTAQTNGAAASNLRLHLPWLDSSAPDGAKLPSTGNVNASATPLKEVAGQTRSGSTSTTQVASRSTGAGGHLAPGGQNLTAAVHPDNATQSSLTDEASVQGTSATGEANTAGAASSPAAAAAPTTGAQALPWTYGANMQETIETIHATVALASRQGAAQAQISLEPAELGAVRIHLTQTGEGLVARVSAETAAGAQAIASGQSELHNTLSSLGISLLRLEVGSFTQQQAQAGGQSQQRSQQPARLTLAGEQAEEIAAASPTGTVSLSSTSALIDVLA